MTSKIIVAIVAIVAAALSLAAPAAVEAQTPEVTVSDLNFFEGQVLVSGHDDWGFRVCSDSAAYPTCGGRCFSTSESLPHPYQPVVKVSRSEST